MQQSFVLGANEAVEARPASFRGGGCREDQAGTENATAQHDLVPKRP